MINVSGVVDVDMGQQNTMSFTSWVTITVTGNWLYFTCSVKSTIWKRKRDIIKRKSVLFLCSVWFHFCIITSIWSHIYMVPHLHGPTSTWSHIYMMVTHLHDSPISIWSHIYIQWLQIVHCNGLLQQPPAISDHFLHWNLYISDR